FTFPTGSNPPYTNPANFFFSAQAGTGVGCSTGTLQWNTNLSDPCGPDVQGTNSFSNTSNNSFTATIIDGNTSNPDILQFQGFDLVSGAGPFSLLNLSNLTINTTQSYTIPSGGGNGSSTTYELDNGGNIDGTFTITAKPHATVPEPSTWLVLTIGG